MDLVEDLGVNNVDAALVYFSFAEWFDFPIEDTRQFDSTFVVGLLSL
jgi:hypothetical protein